ncbi:MAG: hypothetical protein H7240_07520 [Glaciimonas sp.]|nr:hypothetical protein [Glaciimonas sp.]
MQVAMRLALIVGATKTTWLALNILSHCELFNAAALDIREAFSRIKISRPGLTYLSTDAV